MIEDFICFCPEQCLIYVDVQNIIRKLYDYNLIHYVFYIDLEQSMKNGGGPACLRFGFQKSEYFNFLNTKKNLLTLKLYDELLAWIKQHYPTRISKEDFENDLIGKKNISIEPLYRMLGFDYKQ